MGTDSILSYLDSFAPLAPARSGTSGVGSTFEELSVGSEARKLGVGELAAKTTDKGYRALVENINTTSYSILERLSACPRAFALDKLKAASEIAAGVPEAKNIDFVYGHSVGAGVQGLLASDNNLVDGLWASFIGWKAHYDFGTSDTLKYKNKSITTAALAIETFHHMLPSHEVLSHYEVMRLDDGRPAIELAFCFDTDDGYQYYGHIDAIVRSKLTGKLAVMEFKTTGLNAVAPALFANSNQALGYAVALDSIMPGQTEYDVIYCIYQPKTNSWTVLEFHKSFKKKAEWVQDILLAHQQISTYRQLNHYPKRGSSCMNYNRPCEWFGECDFVQRDKLAKLPVLATGPEGQRAEVVDYYFTLSEVIGQQKRNMTPEN
jgi:hypothetical protein